MRPSLRACLALGLPVILLTTACSGDAPTPGAQPAVAADGGDRTAGPTGSPVGEAPSTGAVTSFDEARPAVIQIVAQGSLRDPEVGTTYAAGSGSGFIISPDGLAVTNNHVVTGAATLEVYIGGDTSRSYNARVVGASECNDLALIDISESEPLPYLEWSDQPIETGLEIYAAGFPLGDPEYTLTRGIVAKARADGDITGLSSIDHTIEHDAKAHPGNSGGPLLTADGQVAGVHYAGGRARETTDHQTFGIAHDLAAPVVERLRNGDFESLGINGMPVYDEALGVSGIWVAGVKPGSPAARSQVLPGDIITSLNGLPMAMDGTMKDYCDVLRTAGDDAAVAIEVLRWDTQEFLRGELNSPIETQAALAPVLSFADEVGETVDDAPTGDAAGYGYESVTDDLNQIVVDVPTAWVDRDTAPQQDDSGATRPYIAAAADLDAFGNSWNEPGLVFTVTDPVDDVYAFLDGFGLAEVCTSEGVEEYSDPVFTGAYQVWSGCNGADSIAVLLAAVPADGSYTAAILAQITSQADLEALDRAFATFNVIG
jgi:serine protease Do